MNLTVQYATLPGFNAAFGFSGSDGTWRDFFDRFPLSRQNGLEYQAFTDCGFVLGAIVLEDAPAESFTFPTERSSVDCRLTASPTLELTHNFNRIAVKERSGVNLRTYER